MIEDTLLDKINIVIEDYFAKNETVKIVPVKELMPAFIAAGIFKKDVKKGMPIRKILRTLDTESQLEKIPCVHAERTEKDVYWYFIPKGSEAPKTPYKQSEKSDEPKKTLTFTVSDENYVIDLCDKVLKQKSMRQKTFGFLLGDLHKDGKSQTRLPVDAFYEEAKLVVEYASKVVERPVNEDRPEKNTVSGVTRSEQRKRYDQRKEEVLPNYGIRLVRLSYADFSCDEANKLKRNEEADLKVVERALSAPSNPKPNKLSIKY